MTRLLLALGLLVGPALAQEAPVTTPPAADPAAEAVVPPELLEFIEADYPEAAQAAGRQAAVLLALTINADGSTTDIEVVEPAGDGFDEAAVAAVSRFRFRPATQAGQPIPVRIQYRYAFTLKTVVEEVVSKAPTGRLEGRLREAGTRRPLPGLTVQLPALNQETITDAQGVFAFPEVPGHGAAAHR